MQSLIVGAIAVFAGVLVGFWLRAFSAKAEKAHLEQRVQELASEQAAARANLAQSQAETAAKAGFESLAAEREKTAHELSAERDRLRSDLQAKAEAERVQTGRISQLETELRNERQNLAEKLALLESAKQTLANQFEALAGEILEKKSKSFSEGSQKELGTLLTPLREQIKEFREKVEKAQADSSTGVTKLETLIGTLGGLNQQLSEEAKNLTTALRGSSKAQGDWGEFILRDLLEKAGLREGEQYSFQQSFGGLESDDGEKAKSARTDVIVYLPGGRHLVVDSKVSLTAYTDFANAENEEERKAALREHLRSVRGNVTGLSKAGYESLPGLQSPDFVVMFVPVEPAFLIALQNDSTLWADAYHQKILLVGPTTLLYVIRIVSVLWHQDDQIRNVDEVMDRGAKLYEKFVGFIDDMEEIGNSLNSASKSYSEARKKLSAGTGNLVSQVEKLRELGVKRRPQIGVKPKPQKNIPLKWLAAAVEYDAEGEQTEFDLAASAEVTASEEIPDAEV
jgi:DNA recombination protein RmuC